MKKWISLAAVTVSCLSAVYLGSSTVFAADTQPPKEGWQEEDGKRFYYQDDKPVTGCMTIDGIPYVFAKNGAQKVGWQTYGEAENAKRYFYSTNGDAIFGWIKWRGEMYYVSKENGKLTGDSQLDDGTEMLFDGYGVRALWQQTEDGVWFIPDADGELTIDGVPYLFDSKGALLTGWQTASDGIRRFYSELDHSIYTGWVLSDTMPHRYADPERGMLTGLQQIDGKTYYFDSEGYMQTGEVTIDGRTVILGEDGVMLTGWNGEGAAKRYYDPETGEMAVGFKTIGDSTYYFEENGTLRHGWSAMQGRMRYFDPETGAMYLGLRQIAGNLYFFEEDGYLHTEWLTENGSKYYFDTATGQAWKGEHTLGGVTYCFRDDGTMLTGWDITASGKRYFDPETGAMAVGQFIIDGTAYTFGTDGYVQTSQVGPDGVRRYFDDNGNPLSGWQTINGKKVYLLSDGAAASGAVQMDGKLYVFDADGSAAVGWYTDKSGAKYYAGTDGIALTGWQEIDKKSYFFLQNGTMAVNTAIDGYQIGADGIARTQLAATVDTLLGYTNRTPNGIYSYCVSHYWYSKIEATRTVNQLLNAGWINLVTYTVNNRAAVCYYLAATYDYFLQRAGYTTRMVHSYHGTGDHYWCQVLIDGVWHNYDPTYTNRGDISWNYQISLGNYIVLGYLTVDYDARGAYVGYNYTPA